MKKDKSNLNRNRKQMKTFLSFISLEEAVFELTQTNLALNLKQSSCSQG